MNASPPLSREDKIRFARTVAKKKLLGFAAYCDRYFEIHPHHRKIAEALERIERGQLKRLRIEMPPRSGKSRMVQEFVPWYLGRNPNKDVIYTGHSVGLLQGFSRNIRNRIQSQEYASIFDTKVANDDGAVNNWKTDKGGEFAIFGVGGGITGKGFHVGIIDDAYASREDVESDTIRSKVFDWYNSTFYSRRQNKDAAIILIMQRWREDDLAGQLEEQDGDEWEVIKIPAISESEESFWPDKFPVSDLYDIRKKIGDYFFQSQYQQDPVNEGGGSFRRDYFSYSDTVPENLRVYSFVDPAISQKQEADYTAIVTIGVDPIYNQTHLLDVFRERVEPDALIDELFRICERWNPYAVGIETVQYQKMLALEIKKQMRLRNKFFPLHESKPSGEKEARIRASLQPRYSSGAVTHWKSCRNLQEYETELLKFPNGKHDDTIDAASSAFSLAFVELSEQSVYERVQPVDSPYFPHTEEDLQAILDEECNADRMGEISESDDSPYK